MKRQSAVRAPKPFLSVIIPAYNEAERIPHTLIDIDAKLRERSYSYEIIVVDDGSKDGTADIVRALSAKITGLKIVPNEANRGKGAVVRQGMLLASGTYRLFTDADNSTSIAQFDKMTPEFRKGFDIVIGSRAVRGAVLEPPQPFARRLLGKLSNLVIQLVNLPGIWDTQCGFKAFTAEAAEAVFPLSRVAGWGFDIEVLSLARALGFKIKEIPVRWVNDANSRVKPSAYLKTFVENLTIRSNILTGRYNLKFKNQSGK